MKIGTLTIGQSPRDDILPEFIAALGPGIELLHHGALDNLSREEIASFEPEDDDDLLVTRLKDGSEVKIAERCIVPRMQSQIHDHERNGVACIALFCTGEFPELSCGVPFLRPDRLLVNLIRGIADDGVLAAVVPNPKQIPGMSAKWRRTGWGVHAFALSPYTASRKEVQETAAAAAAVKPDLVVLDCMGFGMDIRKIFFEHTGKPVLLPRTILARIAAEIL